MSKFDTAIVAYADGETDVVTAQSPLASRLALARALVPGWAVVPREPTEAMQVAAYNAWAAGPPLTIVGEAVATYRAMLTAAEEPPHGP